MAKAITLDHLELHALKSANYTDKKVLELSSGISGVISSKLAEAKASGEFDGEKGDPGVSATHSWNGTTLTVTSASGTSSANLKGDNGTSVTVSSVSESTASGGSNVVNFSDGKKVTIKNGKDGSNYVLTDADKTNIANQAAALVVANYPNASGVNF